MNLFAQNVDLGKITAPSGVPTPTDPSTYVSSFIRNGIMLLIIVAFIVDLLYTIIAGIRFITANGDEKAISSATSQIWWGMIGMVVVIGAYAIIKLVETFFGVNIVSGGFNLPTP